MDSLKKFKPCSGCGGNKTPLSPGMVAKGVRGLAKVAAGIDNAPEAVREERRRICAECLGVELGWRTECPVCRCFIKAKTRLKAERCPDGKWGRLEQKQPVVANGVEKPTGVGGRLEKRQERKGGAK